MKDVITFLGFVIYASFIFFINSNLLLGMVLLINILAMIIYKIKPIDALQNIIKLLPFILLTVVINCILANYQYAFLVAIKLVLVCHITFIYAKTITVRNLASTIKSICTPLKLFKVNLEDIQLLVCISLSMLPVLKTEYTGVKEACLAKGIAIKASNMKPILVKLMVSVMKRVNHIEESMIEKGYGEV